MTAEASRPERWRAFPVQERLPCRSAVRTSAEKYHYLNETTGNVREIHISMIEKEGRKGTQCTMVLPWGAAIALKQTCEKLARFAYLTAAGPMEICVRPDALGCSQWKNLKC